MLNNQFKSLTKHSQAWIVAMIASWDDFDKCSELLIKYVGTPNYFKLYQKSRDTFFIAQYDEMNIVGWCGTKNIQAWLSDFAAWTGWGDFHPGIYHDTKKYFIPEIQYIYNRKIYTLCSGQSRGGSDALISNYILKKYGFGNVESWNFSGPPICDKNGIIEMKNHEVRNTNFNTDPFGQLPSDPTDDATIDCLHYGEDHRMYGGAGPFDHSYHQITLHLASWMNFHGFKDDALFLLELTYPDFKHNIIKK